MEIHVDIVILPTKWLQKVLLQQNMHKSANITFSMQLNILMKQKRPSFFLILWSHLYLKISKNQSMQIDWEIYALYFRNKLMRETFNARYVYF